MLQAVVLVAPLTNDFDEFCLLALVHRTPVFGCPHGLFSAGDLSITIFGVLDGTRMGVVQEVVVAEPGFAGVTFDWQEI